MPTLGANAPARLGRYELLARLATGGMGEIFLARLEGAEGFEKLFVVKRILPHLADDARFRGMLIAEARIASKMSHANICQVYELGDADGQLYIVMEYLEGIALLPLLRKASRDQHKLELGFVGGIVQQVSDALHYAHELKDRNGETMGIVHRDVTPGNIFLTESGVAKVLDFGIAKVKDASQNTQTGTVKGKYAYMAPEQLRGSGIDRRADVFALGVVIYEMLALRRLFQRKTDYLTFRAVMEQPVPDVRRYRPDVPDALAEVLLRTLDREPDKRPDSARALGSAVLDALGLRPWTQGELGDHVRANFADEIGRRSAQVATAVRRSEPLIEEPEITQVDDEDDEEFPPVDSVVGEVVARPGSGFAGSRLPDGSGDAHPALRPIAQTAAVPKRSLVWPIVAIAMVLIAGGALFLVWRTMQTPAQTQVVNITTEPAQTVEIVGSGTAVVQPGGGSGSATMPGSGSGSGSATTTVKKAVPVTPSNPWIDAIRGRKAEMTKCAQDHGAPPPAAKVNIVIHTNGRVKTVGFQPKSLEGTPLGNCIRNVLSPIAFPKAKDETTISFTLTAAN